MEASYISLGDEPLGWQSDEYEHTYWKKCTYYTRKGERGDEVWSYEHYASVFLF